MRIKSINFRLNRHWPGYLLVVLLISATITNLRAETLRIAVASNFLKTAQNLSALYESQNEHAIQLSSGSSGKLYFQITQGAPFDLFFSADSDKPEQLISNHYAVAGSRQTYAIGKLSLWLKKCPQPATITTLKSPFIQKIAIANPELAPYGAASHQLLKNYQLLSSVKNKLVFPENISQVSQLVKTGVVDAAFIALSQAKDLILDKQSCLINLVEKDYPAIKQQLVLLSTSNKQAIAEEFIQFIHSQKAQDLIKSMGYSVSESDKIND